MAFITFRGVLFSATPSKELPRRVIIKKLITFVFPQIKIIMQQIYHSNAKTNVNIRLQLQNNFETNFEIASKFNITKQTVSK
ncbi:MAG: hypothetical protein EAZ27_10015 [Cytophagales bacterium]|nr:MAG: hypothetical protein EAZ27_10015 [Cytophagales bacterium]